MFKCNKVQSTAKAGALSVAIAAAMTGIGVAGLSSSAQAVSIAHDGLGEAMIFPYYTVRNNYSSFFNITNTSPYTVFIKVRWNEGENSRDARDFNVVLSPYDMWAVATTDTGLKLSGGSLTSIGDEDGDGNHDSNGMALTADNSCTVPSLLTYTDDKGQPILDASGQTLGMVPFTNEAYTTNDFDTGNTGHDRTREGYFTVFEMGLIDNDAVVNRTGIYAGALGTDGFDRQARALKVIKSAEHSNVRDNAGIPGGDEPASAGLGCAHINKYYTGATTGEFTLSNLSEITTEPRNVLKGRAVLINLATGVAQGYDPITLENYFNPQGIDGFDTGNLMFQPSTKEPNLNDTFPAAAQYVSGSTLVNNPHIGSFAGADAVSELLSRSNVINDYNLTSGSQTDWVITFPTKKFYVDADMSAGTTGDNFAIDRSDLLVPGDTAYPHDGAKPNHPFSTATVFYDEDKNADGDRGDREGSAGESCIEIGFELRDREEFKGVDPVGAAAFSPAPKTPNAKPASLCKEANILSFANSNIYDSKLRSALFEDDIGGLPGLNGWANISLPTLPVGATSTITGTPVVGMRLEARENARNPLSRYGFSSDHAYKR